MTRISRLKISYDFYRIPSEVFKNKGLSPFSRLLYAVIYKYAWNGRAEFCWASDTHLAEIIGSSERTVKKCINELVACGYIEVEFCKGKTRKIYPQCDLEVYKEERVTPKEEKEQYQTTNTVLVERFKKSILKR